MVEVYALPVPDGDSFQQYIGLCNYVSSEKYTY